MFSLNHLKSLFIVSVAAVSITASANSGFYLGKASLMDRQDTDVIQLPPCAAVGNKPVSSLRLEVHQFAADIDDLDVVFYNGERQDLTVKESFKPGQSSRWLDLRGAKRCIKKIVIKGDSDTFGNHPLKQAQVLFYGM